MAEDMGATPLVLLQPSCPPGDDPEVGRVLAAIAASLGISSLRLELRLEGATSGRSYAFGPGVDRARVVELEVEGLESASLHLPGETRPPDGVTALAALAVEQVLVAFALRRQALLLRATLDTTTSAVLLFQPPADIVYANPPADRLLSRQTEDALLVEQPGAAPTPLFHLLGSLVERIAASNDVATSWLGTLALSDGSVLACELLQVHPGADGERRSVLAILQTVTALPGRCLDALAASYRISPREEEVVRLLQDGLTVNGMAERLSLSPHTVRDHLRHLYRKTGTTSRRDLLGLLRRATLAPPLDPHPAPEPAPGAVSAGLAIQPRPRRR